MQDQFTADDFSRTVDCANFGFWSWDIDTDVIRWSSQLGKIYGLDSKDFPNDIAAMSLMLPTTLGMNLQSRIFEATDQASGQFELEHPIHRDGDNAWIRNSGRVEFDDQKRPIKLTAIATDITEQKQAELKLQTREEQFRRFSELTSDYIYECDMTVEPLVPYLVAGSYEHVVGFTAAELAEKGGWTSIINPDDLKVGLDVWKQLEAGVPTVHEYRIVNKQGEVRWIRDHSNPTIEDGKLVKVVGGVKDISETKVLQDQLIAAQKNEVMANLVGAVAHDFNNLIHVISATTEVMALENTVAEDLQSDILLACNRASELTRSLLAFTRKDLPQNQTVRLSQAINDASGMLHRAVGEQVRIHVTCADGVNDKVDIDPGHLQLVLLNLATNARTAMSNHGELIISIAAVDPNTPDIPQMDRHKTIQLDIIDTGCGIETHYLHRVFEPFFTTKPVGEGSGIGLATCRQIIEQAGGTIHVRSDVANGTTFSIFLPSVDTEVSEAATPAANCSFGGKERILVIEDDAHVQRTTMRTLQSYGYQVSGVDCVNDARQAIANDNYDMLLVDVQLPDGDGYSFVRELRATNHNMPVLMVSGYMNADIRTGISFSEYDLLYKPYSAVDLARSVRATLHSEDSISASKIPLNEPV